jgi:thioredoxin-dependent peroxiredoxin
MRLTTGDIAPSFEAVDLAGENFALDQPRRRRVLLSFLRYASCPMCLLRIDELVRAKARLETEDIDVVVVLHSPRKRILQHVRRELPFRVIPDADRRLYRLYRVETSWPRLLVSVLRPSFYARWIVATWRGYLGGAVDGEFARLPADFLIAGDGTIMLAHYGSAVGDHVDLERLGGGRR